MPEDGLSAFRDEGDDLMMALARKIVSGDADEAETLEEVFAQDRHVESGAEELLVDAGWRPVEVDQESADVNGNGHHDALEPTVEVVRRIGKHGNGHDEDPDE